MACFTAVYTAYGYHWFSNESDRSSYGFPRARADQAKQVRPGDRLICYMKGMSRWVGVHVVLENSVILQPDPHPEWGPWVVRFRVRPLVWLLEEWTIPIRDESIWNRLSFTRDHAPSSTRWTMPFVRAPHLLSPDDGDFLESVLLRQDTTDRITYPFSSAEYQRLVEQNEEIEEV
jgi:hypothetical protein